MTGDFMMTLQMFFAARTSASRLRRPSLIASGMLSPWLFEAESVLTMLRSFWARTCAATFARVPGSPSSLPLAHQSVITAPVKPHSPRRIVESRS